MEDEPDTKESSEFDSYAEGYSAGMENPVKRFLGRSFSAFIELKVRWLLADLTKKPLKCATVPEAIKLLDFGCGTGEFLKILRKKGFKGQLEGCDISEGMLKEAAKHWSDGSLPPLHSIRVNEKLPFAENSYDLVVVNCIFHHIELSQHSRILGELTRILKPGGRIAISEHNPWNPVTRNIVSNTPIDRNAVLITTPKLRQTMSSAGLDNIRVNYLLFFPPSIRWRWLKRVESILPWLPIGGQYVIVGEKPTEFDGKVSFE